jgi:hypothetical protein
MAQTPLAPRAEIRRFDIFAEWNRLKARHHHHLPEPEAQAYGLAVAKVVAARKFAGSRPAQLKEWKRRAHDRPNTEQERMMIVALLRWDASESTRLIGHR